MSIFPQPPGDEEGLTQAPDLQQATGVPQGGSMGLLEALGSMGSMGGGAPSEAVLSLLGGPTQGQKYAQALAGGVAYAQGRPNPVSQIINDQQRQQIGIAAMLQKMQDSRDLKAYREEGRVDARNKSQQAMMEKYTGDLIASGDPKARLYGWTARSQQMAKDGMPIPPDLLEGLARKDLTKDTMENAVRLVGDMPYPQIMAMYKELRPEHEPFLLAAKNSDAYRKVLQLPSKLEDERDADIHEWKRQAANLADIREQRQAAAEERMSKAQEVAAQRAEDTSRHQLFMEGIAVRSANRADQSLSLAERRLEAQKAEWDRKFETKDDKKQAGFNVMTEWLNTLDTTADALEKKNYLPKSTAGPLGGLLTGNVQPGQAKLNRDLFYNDKDYALWTQMLQGGGIGFERTVLNDIGPRAMAAFKGIQSFFDNPPTREAIRDASNFMRKEIDIARGRPEGVPQTLVYKSGGKVFEERWKKGDPLPPDAEILTIDGVKPPSFMGK